jgi:superfamily I DNA and RNA helicase
VFLHPAQREIVTRSAAGPARVAGSAGTGKTVVALHRAARLAQAHPQSRILLTTFSQPLARLLEQKLRLLVERRLAHHCGRPPQRRERAL